MTPATMLQPIIVDWDSNSVVAAGTFIALLGLSRNHVMRVLMRRRNFVAIIHKNTVTVTCLSAVSCNSTPTKTPATGGNILAPDDTITVVITGVFGSPTNAAIQINLQTSLP